MGWQGRDRRRGSDEFDRFIGHRLRQERRLAGIDQEELGNALGVGVQVIRDYECGAKRLPPDRFVAATAALSVPMSLFFYEGDEDTSGPDDEEIGHKRWIGVRRPPQFLSRPGFAHVLPIMRLWQETSGELTEEVHSIVVASPLCHRMILVRQPPHSSRLITQHVGSGIRILLPCESFLAIGRDFDEHHPDREYAAWVAEAYAETLRSRRLRVESVRALVRTSAATTLRTRYDRVLIPWSSRAGDLFTMAISIQREVPVAV